MSPHRSHSTAPDSAKLLASHDLRVTEQRVTVLDAMMEEDNDVTAQTLHTRLRPAHPQLGLATVYRTLAVLADAGILDRLYHGHDGETSVCYRYCEPGHHHHLVCRSCHTVVELRDCDLDAWARRMGQAHGFGEIEHAVELHGTCSDCLTA